MKNILLALVTILVFPCLSFSQDFPDFGTASGAEIDLKECSFDKDANAVILLDEAISNHDEEYHLITDYHVKIKILKEKGFEAANISIPFYRKDDFEFIERLEAVVINTDASGQVTTEKLSKKAFYKKEINERYGEITFVFPNIKVGSIIEYKYRSFMKNYGGLQNWYFQKELPVVKSRYTLTIVPNGEFTYRVNKKTGLPIIVKQDNDNARLYFEMNNIASLNEEPYMDAREDYVQKVIFQLSAYNNGFGKTNYMASWDEVTRELLSDKDFGSQLGKNISGIGDFMNEVKKMPVDEDKMKAVYNYVRKNMSWNGQYSKYAIDGVKSAWEKKKGNSGEINLVLVNLLKDAGLEAYPTLVSKRFHGKVNADYPFIDQFNSVFACVIIKGVKYYLDATDEYTPAHMTPYDILNTTAFIVNRKNGGLVKIANDSLEYRDYISTLVNLDDNGVFSGDAFVRNSGYSRIEKVSSYKNNGKDKYIDRYFQKNGVKVNDFEFMNLDNDSLSAEQKFKFSTSLATPGDYLYVPLDIFTGFEKNPFISQNRFSNVNFGYKRNISTRAAITLPKNYVVDALPKPIKMTTPDNDILFTRSVSYDKESHSLTCLLVFEFKKSLYDVDEYDILKQVYKKMFDYLKEPVVLKKK